jgi:phage terminase large subunit-like protein
VAAGLGHDGIGRVLEDATGRYSPDGWANKALALFDRWKADKIVAPAASSSVAYCRARTGCETGTD